MIAPLPIRRVFLPELMPHEQRRLGRHLVHDERSRDYPAAQAPEVMTVRHVRRAPIFSQGNLGSCTGNAAAGLLCTDPFTSALLDESDAVALYSEATRLDDIGQSYPPDDTGSSGLAVMQALLERGAIASYSHAFGIDHVLAALTLRPGITGLTWLTGCDAPDERGVVSYTGAVRGGHEVELIGIDAEQQLVWCANSWGEAWGAAGYFAFTWDDYARALADGGDATFAEPC